MSTHQRCWHSTVHVILMDAVSLFLMYWRYYSLALSHWCLVYNLLIFGKIVGPDMNMMPINCGLAVLAISVEHLMFCLIVIAFCQRVFVWFTMTYSELSGESAWYHCLKFKVKCCLEFDILYSNMFSELRDFFLHSPHSKYSGNHFTEMVQLGYRAWICNYTKWHMGYDYSSMS